jgi:hypothetical protein
MGTVSGTTHTKAILILSPGTGTHFIGSALCSSEDSVMQLIHTVHFFHDKQYLVQTPRRKNSDKNKVISSFVS